MSTSSDTESDEEVNDGAELEDEDDEDQDDDGTTSAEAYHVDQCRCPLKAISMCSSYFTAGYKSC